MRDTAADFSESDKLSRFDLIYLLPIALALGLTGLAAFLWSLTSPNAMTSTAPHFGAGQ